MFKDVQCESRWSHGTHQADYSFLPNRIDEVDGRPIFLDEHKHPAFMNLPRHLNMDFLCVPLFGLLCKMHIEQWSMIQVLQIQVLSN